jgi:hypothetical protein
MQLPNSVTMLLLCGLIMLVITNRGVTTVGGTYEGPKVAVTNDGTLKMYRTFHV